MSYRQTVTKFFSVCARRLLSSEWINLEENVYFSQYSGVIRVACKCSHIISNGYELSVTIDMCK